jgi:hypothetical protein
MMVFDFWEQEEHRCLEQMKKSIETLKTEQGTTEKNLPPKRLKMKKIIQNCLTLNLLFPNVISH